MIPQFAVNRCNSWCCRWFESTLECCSWERYGANNNSHGYVWQVFVFRLQLYKTIGQLLN